jgi:glutaredoxin
MKLKATLAGLALLTIACATLAQSVYRNVDKNGKVTFSDQPPSANAQPAEPRAGSSIAPNSGLPYELRQVAQRYPVTLYSGDECGPCGAGRSLLITRGVPFEERTVKTSEDINALQRLSGQNSLPLLSIGTQQLKGFSDAEWSQYLDAAGYPKSAQLPTGFRNPPPQPLVALQPAARPAPAVAPSPAIPASPPPPAVNEPTPSNPAGIKF